ncbi:MAG: radical SAM protein [Myxococcales bacterium]|nr:radical SAM protein [Myxococcales bacterium]
MKALIKVGYRCNDHCSFCHTLEVRHVDGDAAEVDRKIRRAAELGHTMIVLSGGEPTIRPELMHWARLSASLGLDFGLVTNGRMLAYPAVVDELLEHRLRYVYLSLHGGSAKIHNLMVRSDAFEQTFGALKNLSGRGLDLHVNCVVTRHNVDHLIALVEATLPYRDATVKFSMVEPKGGGSRLFDHLMPPVAHVAARVRAAIEHGRARAGAEGPRFRHGALPLCLMPGLEDAFDDLKTHRYRTMIEVGEPDFYPVDDDNKLHPPACEGCALRGPCPGLYRGYHEVFGDGEVRPLRGRPRPNSFNYVYEAMVADGLAAGDPCPILADGVTPWDRGRDLFVEHGPKIARFRAESRDFSDRELVTIKRELGQVYVDVSRKAAPDDFARDLVKLERSPRCAGCPAADACAGLYRPSEVEVFARDDAWVRARLALLEGEVVDLGCGEAPYLDVLGPRIAGGAITYLGLDPDRRALAALARRAPAAELRAAPAEALADPADPLGLGERRFDHALILRSWNHLEDPGRALRALCARLGPGGTLMIVDNVAFGLARTPAQARRGERSPARFEHFRNDDAAAAIKMVEESCPMELVLVERRDVGPETSNQWVLIYRRAEDESA